MGWRQGLWQRARQGVPALLEVDALLQAHGVLAALPDRDVPVLLPSSVTDPLPAPAVSPGKTRPLTTVEALPMMEPSDRRASSTPPPADAVSVSTTGVPDVPAANGAFTNWMAVLPAGVSAMRSATAIVGVTRLPLACATVIANDPSARSAEMLTDCTLT